MGNSKNYTPRILVTTGLPENVVNNLDKIAERDGTSRAAVARRFMMAGYRAYIRDQREIRDLKTQARENS